MTINDEAVERKVEQTQRRIERLVYDLHKARGAVSELSGFRSHPHSTNHNTILAMIKKVGSVTYMDPEGDSSYRVNVVRISPPKLMERYHLKANQVEEALYSAHATSFSKNRRSYLLMPTIKPVSGEDRPDGK